MSFTLYKDGAGYWRWRLRAANNKIIADSGEGYHNRADALSGISLVKQANNVPVYEATNV